MLNASNRSTVVMSFSSIVVSPLATSHTTRLALVARLKGHWKTGLSSKLRWMLSNDLLILQGSAKIICLNLPLTWNQIKRQKRRQDDVTGTKPGSYPACSLVEAWRARGLGDVCSDIHRGLPLHSWTFLCLLTRGTLPSSYSRGMDIEVWHWGPQGAVSEKHISAVVQRRTMLYLQRTQKLLWRLIIQCGSLCEEMVSTGIHLVAACAPAPVSHRHVGEAFCIFNLIFQLTSCCFHPRLPLAAWSIWPSCRLAPHASLQLLWKWYLL